MMDNEFIELKRLFILEEDIEHEELKQMITLILKYCKIDKNGTVIVQDRKIRLADRILLVISARYLANRLQRKLEEEPTIPDEINNSELAELLRAKEPVIRARMADLRKVSMVTQLRPGVHSITPHAIEKLLTKLEADN